MKVKDYSEIVIIYLAMSIFFAFLALVLFYPRHPMTLTGGTFWLFAVLPAWIIGEGIISLFVNDKIGKLINQNTSKTSVGRIGYGIFILCLFLLIFGFFTSVIGNGFNNFFEKNFSATW